MCLPPGAIDRAHSASRRLSIVGAAPTSPLSLDVAHLAVKRIHACLIEMTSTAGVSGPLGALVQDTVLPAAFPVLLHWRHGHVQRAREALFRIWIDQALVMGALDAPVAPAPSRLEASGPFQPSDEDAELLGLYQWAVLEHLQHARNGDQGRLVLRRLATSLGLSFDELGRMFQVSGETARRWERGAAPIPAERTAALTSAAAGLDRLLAIFLPDRLAGAIRRPADLFDGDRALDWILRGKIEVVADRYDRALSFQQ